MTTASKGAVVVTGASSGIGRACALELDRLGFRVFAGIRKEADAESLRAEASDRLTPIHLDVTDEASVAAAARVVAEAVGPAGLHGLVNNAGVAAGAPLEYLPTAELRRVLEINVLGVHTVTRSFLPLLRQGRGRIVQISSVSGRVAFPLMGPYAASKFALEALSDALRVELAEWGLTVSLIEPGNVRTPIWAKSKAAAEQMLDALPPEAYERYGPSIAMMTRVADHAAMKGMPVGRVTAAVAHALTAAHPRSRYLISPSPFQVWLLRLLPTAWRDRLILTARRRMQGRSGADT